MASSSAGGVRKRPAAGGVRKRPAAGPSIIIDRVRRPRTPLPNVELPTRRVPAPFWALDAHASHELLTLGGIVICGRCGSMAAGTLDRCLLRRECLKTGNSQQAKDVGRLRRGLLPSTFKGEWPNGGADLEEGLAVLDLEAGLAASLRFFVSGYCSASLPALASAFSAVFAQQLEMSADDIVILADRALLRRNESGRFDHRSDTSKRKLGREHFDFEVILPERGACDLHAALCRSNDFKYVIEYAVNSELKRRYQLMVSECLYICSRSTDEIPDRSEMVAFTRSVETSTGSMQAEQAEQQEEEQAEQAEEAEEEEEKEEEEEEEEEEGQNEEDDDDLRATRLKRARAVLGLPAVKEAKTRRV